MSFFFCFLIVFFQNTEIPRVITALQQQNTAPEVQQYDADPYQTDSDSGGGGGAGGGSGGSSGRGEITIRLYVFLFYLSSSVHLLLLLLCTVSLFKCLNERIKFPLKRISMEQFQSERKVFEHLCTPKKKKRLHFKFEMNSCLKWKSF